MRKKKKQQASPSFIRITASGFLGVLSLGCMIAALVLFYHMHIALTDGDILLSCLMGSIFAFVPPLTTSFIFPSTPSGMLFQKLQYKTSGYLILMVVWAFMTYYTGSLLWSWWSSMQVVVEAGLVMHQTIVCVLAFIFLPGMIWIPITDDELIAAVRQDHMIKRYELQANADLALIRLSTLRARKLALQGIANMTPIEQKEFHGLLYGLVNGIDQSVKQIGNNVRNIVGDIDEFDLLHDNEDVKLILDGITQVLLEAPNENDMIEASGPIEEETRAPPIIRARHRRSIRRL